MKKIGFILLFAFSAGMVIAQKQTYYLFAHAKKKTVQICGEKVLIKSAEMSLSAEEAATYRQKYYDQLKTTYNTSNGYEYLFVELVKPGQVVIIYEGEKKFEQRRDGWNCTSTFYGCQIGNDVLTAEKKFAAVQNEYKTSVFKEISRWSNAQIASIKQEDVEVKWVQTKEGIIGFFTNTRKDLAFNVEIKAVKKTAGTQPPNATAEMAVVEKHKLTIQPGEKLTLNFRMADGFNMDAWPVPATEEKEGLIDLGKHLIKQYLTTPGKEIKRTSVAFSVRG